MCDKEPKTTKDKAKNDKMFELTERKKREREKDAQTFAT